jgi:ABC-type nickel/cobalt efflux system permease component RcnA
MDVALRAIFALGFLGGVKHAFEPDHVVAVSTLLDREPRLGHVLRLGSAWGAGHSTMLVAGVLAISHLRLRVSESHVAIMEVPVAVMLLALGGWAVSRAYARGRRSRSPQASTVSQAASHAYRGRTEQTCHHSGTGFRRTGWSGFAVGLVHGLAGSGALLLLVAATLPTLGHGVLYAIVFGSGSVIGMAAVTSALALPYRVVRSRPVVYDAITGISGLLSVVVGAGILWTLVVGPFTW